MSEDGLDKVTIERRALRDRIIEALGPKAGAAYFRIRDIAINVYGLDPRLVDETMAAGVAEGRRRRQYIVDLREALARIDGSPEQSPPPLRF